MSDVVLDASALLAMIFSEPGGEQIVAAFGPESRALISAVNLGEVVAKLVDREYSKDALDEVVEWEGLVTAPFTQAHAVAAGLLRSSTRHLGLSAGDRACLALAAAEGLPVLTADRLWGQLNIGVDIRLIRGTDATA